VALYQEFKDDGLVPVGVNLRESPEAVRAFAQEFRIPFPLLLDAAGQSPRLFGLWGHPNTVLIDRQGRVVGLGRGERDWQSAAAKGLVRQLLTEGEER
jgi:cytochrome c biogenesis protein CcmG, thiol:disulfide interchange protein DsbE